MKGGKLQKQFLQWQDYINGKAFLGYSKRRRKYVLKRYRKKP